MRWIVKYKWLVLALWLAAAAGLMLTAPNMADLVREKGQIQVPEGYPSTAAAEMLKDIQGSEGGGALHSTLLVFHNETGLTDTDFAEIAEGAGLLHSSIAEGSGIVSVVTHLMEPALTPQMLAEDGKTAIVLLQVSLEGREPAAVQESLGAMLEHLEVNVRTSLKARSTVDMVSMITNTVPGMVLGISYLLFFNGSSLKGTFIIIVLCNIVHFFTTPYLMAKNSLSKMNPSWETTGELLGDSWFKTVYRVILPNSASTVIEMFSYYFINAMVTISGIIFLVSAQTSLVASKIKELQHFAKFNEIFVLSMLIFFTNLIIKLVCDALQRRTAQR